MARDKEPLDVHEVTLRLSVMLQADSPEDAEAAVSEMSIERLGQEIDGGDFIGASQVIASRAVADGQVMHRLLEYGNDGSFFHGAHEVAAKDARNGDMEIVGLQIQQGWSAETLMAISTFEDHQNAEARAKVEAFARELIYLLAELVGTETKTSRAVAATQYRKPESPSLYRSVEGAIRMIIFRIVFPISSRLGVSSTIWTPAKRHSVARQKNGSTKRK